MQSRNTMEFRLPLSIKKEIIGRLQEMVADQLIEITDNQVIVKEEGRMYVRNICMAFDLKLIENKPNTQTIFHDDLASYKLKKD